MHAAHPLAHPAPRSPVAVRARSGAVSPARAGNSCRCTARNVGCIAGRYAKPAKQTRVRPARRCGRSRGHGARQARHRASGEAPRAEAGRRAIHRTVLDLIFDLDDRRPPRPRGVRDRRARPDRLPDRHRPYAIAGHPCWGSQPQRERCGRVPAVRRPRSPGSDRPGSWRRSTGSAPPSTAGPAPTAPRSRARRTPNRTSTSGSPWPGRPVGSSDNR